MTAMRCRPPVVFSPEYECDIGCHVFPTMKYRLVRDALIADGVIRAEDILVPEPASEADLRLVHTAEYLADLAALRRTTRTAMSELPLTAEVVRAYVLGAGGTVLAARRALGEGAGVHIGGGFHHAFAALASGFCYVNDLAVAVRVLQRDGAIARAAVVDCDLHQGNGTAHVFRDDERVFTFSIHQEHLYPVKETSDLDIGLENEADDATFNGQLASALERVWAHRPEIVLYQAGADPYLDDQLGSLRLTLEGLRERDRLVIEGCAGRGIPVVVTLGGGYARRVSDTVTIHKNTCVLALEKAWRRAR
jgi:acetoin utilization deacetylase AcuC-like enzyme